jgi:hypothetical protein
MCQEACCAVSFFKEINQYQTLVSSTVLVDVGDTEVRDR